MGKKIKKSIREMSKREKRKNSLNAKVFNAAAVHSIILGFICFLIGLGMYMNASMQDAMKEAYDKAHENLDIVKQEVDPGKFSKRTLEIYKEHRSSKMDDTYYAYFDEINNDKDYQRMIEILCDTRTEDMSDYFLAVADQKNGKLIIVADTDPRPGHLYPVGKQQSVPGWFQKYFFSRGNGSFPRTYYFLFSRGVICVSGAFIEEGNPEAGFVFVVVRATDALDGVGKFILQYVIAILFAIIVMGYIMTKRMNKSLVEPINSIADAAKAYVADKREGKIDVKHFSNLNIRPGDELENLGLIMADMEEDLTLHEENLTRITAEKERIGTELSLASRIQSNMLPGTFPAFPERKDFDIYATMDPAKEVGGDFYDFFLTDEDHLCIVMADVSGKGVPAALFMMASKIIIANNAMAGKSPAQILSDTNKLICSNNRENMFVTVWLGILEISTGKLTVANAGHEFPVFSKGGAGYELCKDKHGLVVGLMDMAQYVEYETIMKPGDKLFLYTDGIPEAKNAEGDMFGLDRLVDSLNKYPDVSAEQTIKNMKLSVDEFVKESEQFDDLTMLCLEYKGRNDM